MELLKSFTKTDEQFRNESCNLLRYKQNILYEIAEHFKYPDLPKQTKQESDEVIVKKQMLIFWLSGNGYESKCIHTPDWFIEKMIETFPSIDLNYKELKIDTYGLTDFYEKVMGCMPDKYIQNIARYFDFPKTDKGKLKLNIYKKKKLLLINNSKMSKKKELKPMEYEVVSTRRTIKKSPDPKYTTNVGYLTAEKGEAPEVISLLYGKWDKKEKVWLYYYRDNDGEIIEINENWLKKVFIKVIPK